MIKNNCIFCKIINKGYNDLPQLTILIYMWGKQHKTRDKSNGNALNPNNLLAMVATAAETIDNDKMKCVALAVANLLKEKKLFLAGKHPQIC